MEIRDDGWQAYNIWQHSRTVLELYRSRARDEAEEMTCAAQAAELLAEIARPGESVIDAGCGAGHMFHALRRRGLGLDYAGFDATRAFIEAGQAELAPFGLPPDRLRVLRLEDFRGRADHVLCLNVLSNVDAYQRPLERLLDAAGRSLILRESIRDGAQSLYVRDVYLDPEVDLRVHVNAYDRREIVAFIAERGFTVREVQDRRSGGRPETVIGYPHHWTFLVALRH